jgi:hypothetical protein
MLLLKFILGSYLRLSFSLDVSTLLPRKLSFEMIGFFLMSFKSGTDTDLCFMLLFGLGDLDSTYRI